MLTLAGMRIVVTGGTGSLGKVLVRRLLAGEMGRLESVTVFSRDELKQHEMRLAYAGKLTGSTDEIIYNDPGGVLRFVIGDVRDPQAVVSVLREADVVIHAAAMKQVPACERAPREAVRTNVGGALNIVRAIRDYRLPVWAVVGISTDKAVKPVNVYGMTKSLMERVLLGADSQTQYVCVRYGNVLASRGSVLPLFHRQIGRGEPVTITDRRMTRFWLTIDQAVDTIFDAFHRAKNGETWVPQIPAARVMDLAQAIADDRRIDFRVTGVRPGEKLHEILISEEERHRTLDRVEYYGVQPILPELRTSGPHANLPGEYSSADDCLTVEELRKLLEQNDLLNPIQGA